MHFVLDCSIAISWCLVDEKKIPETGFLKTISVTQP